MEMTLLVRKDRLDDVRLRRREDRPLQAGQVRLAVDTLALTANNVTYAAFGQSLDYWRFWPSEEEGWGIVPAWGFASVVQSLHPGIAVGERLYGFWPLANTAVLQPGKPDTGGFRDEAPHRAGLHAIYNRVQRCSADQIYTQETEALQALLRPLFSTAFLLDDFLADNGFFGAQRVLLSSASSKTAWCTAHRLALRGGVERVGLTSAANAAYCARLGVYDRVVTYEQLEQLPAKEPAAYVDFAGNEALRQQIHGHWGAQLRHSCAVGGAHVHEAAGTSGLGGPGQQFFFAPAQAKKRQAQWGLPALQQRLLEAWHECVRAVTGAQPPWLEPTWHRGPEAAVAAFHTVLAGRSDPRRGHVVDLR